MLYGVKRIALGPTTSPSLKGGVFYASSGL